MKQNAAKQTYMFTVSVSFHTFRYFYIQLFISKKTNFGVNVYKLNMRRQS